MNFLVDLGLLSLCIKKNTSHLPIKIRTVTHKDTLIMNYKLRCAYSNNSNLSEGNKLLCFEWCWWSQGLEAPVVFPLYRDRGASSGPGGVGRAEHPSSNTATRLATGTATTRDLSMHNTINPQKYKCCIYYIQCFP